MGTGFCKCKQVKGRPPSAQTGLDPCDWCPIGGSTRLCDSSRNRRDDPTGQGAPRLLGAGQAGSLPPRKASETALLTPPSEVLPPQPEAVLGHLVWRFVTAPMETLEPRAICGHGGQWSRRRSPRTECHPKTTGSCSQEPLSPRCPFRESSSQDPERSSLDVQETWTSSTTRGRVATAVHCWASRGGRAGSTLTSSCCPFRSAVVTCQGHVSHGHYPTTMENNWAAGPGHFPPHGHAVLRARGHGGGGAWESGTVSMRG